LESETIKNQSVLSKTDHICHFLSTIRHFGIGLIITTILISNCRWDLLMKYT